MAVRSIIKILKGRTIQYSMDKLANLYRMQNKENAQYLAYRKEHMKKLMFNVIADTVTKGKYEAEFTGVKTKLSRPEADTILDQMFYKHFSKSNIEKAYTHRGFKFSKTATTGKVVYFDDASTRDFIKLNFPLKRSRIMQGMSDLQTGSVLPTVFDNKVSRLGPNQDLLVEASREALIEIYELEETKRGGGRSVTLPSGRSVGKKSIKMDTSQAVKAHGGDLPHPNATLPADANLPEPHHVEGTTARVADMLNVLKSNNFKKSVERVAGQEIKGTSFELGFNKVLEKLDMYFEINGETVSNIVKNEKDFEIGVQIAARHFNVGDKNLMALGDSKEFKHLLLDIELDLMKELSDPEAKTSESMKTLHTDRAAQAMIKEIFSGPLTKKGTPDMRFKVNKALMNKKGTKNQSTAEFKESWEKLTKAVIFSKASAKKKSVKKGIERKVPENDASLVRLMGHINRALPRHLKRNMEPPALQYRGRGNPSRPFAGPFNRGVRATAVRPDPKNIYNDGVIIDYTYEKYPYQTFEPGFLKGDVMRDPRKLIEESIRDVLIERRITKFLTMRRV
tara:strand:- start:683 stop:2377 length:1695 start_codon:yes stop_codon:yes gene_type:complete